MQEMQETWIWSQRVKKIPWRRKWQPVLVFLPTKSHRQMRPGGATVPGVTKTPTGLRDWAGTYLHTMCFLLIKDQCFPLKTGFFFFFQHFNSRIMNSEWKYILFKHVWEFLSGWCTGMTQRDGMGRDVGGGFRIGNTCTTMVDWFMLMYGKTNTIL